MINLERIFQFAGLIFLISAIFHFVGIFFPINASPPIRHAVFVAINIFCVLGFVRRPPYFVFLFALLLVQQYSSHGSSLIRNWNESGLIDWIDLLVVILLPIFLIALILERKNKKRHSE